MQAEYVWNAPANDQTSQNFFQDLIDILTGETDVNNLSIDCNKTSSWIDTSLTTSPWVMHDAAAGPNLKVIKTTQADSGDTKFLGINVPAVTSADIKMAVMSAWNEIAHTGTDYHLLTNTGPQSGFSTSVTGSLYIYASRECILIMMANVSGRYGNYNNGSGSDIGTLIIGEHTRGPSTQIGDQPNWFVGTLSNAGGIQDSGSGAMSGYKWSGREVSATNVVSVVKPYKVSLGAYTRSILRSYNNFNNYSVTLNASQARQQIGSSQPQSEAEAIQYKPEFLLVGGSAYGTASDASTIQGNVSLQCDIWQIPSGSIAIGRYMNWNGKRYRVWKGGNLNFDTGSSVGVKLLVPLG